MLPQATVMYTIPYNYYVLCPPTNAPNHVIEGAVLSRSVADTIGIRHS